MSVAPIDLLGGKSVYCMNEGQLNDAFALAESTGESGHKIREMVEMLEKNFTRNERAAVSFVTIDNLKASV